MEPTNITVTPQTTTTQLPAELVGKSAEEMYASLKAEHEREMEELRKTIIPPQPTQTPATPTMPNFMPPPPPVPSFNQEPTQTEPDYLTSPQAYMDHQFQQRVAPLAMNIAQGMQNTNREIFKGRIGAEWDKYGAGIDQFVESLHPSVRMQIGAYEAAYNYVRGTQVDKIVEEEANRRAAEMTKQVLSSYGIEPTQQQQPAPKTSLFQPSVGVVTSPTPPTHFTTTAPQKSILTPEEKRIADMFGLKEEEYVELSKQNTDWVSQAKGRI